MNLSDRWRRWKYRRLAWKDDTWLWCSMHPRLAQLIDRLYRKGWPLRIWVSDFFQGVRDYNKAEAVRTLYGPAKGEVKYWKHDGDATDLYTAAREQGWTPEAGWPEPEPLRCKAHNNIIVHWPSMGCHLCRTSN